jgi:transcriptional regulator with XRE-family HTH domain
MLDVFEEPAVSVRPSTIGERIKQLRLERDPQMTQRELAERAGVSVDLISKLEQGQKQTALVVTLHKIAGALDVDVSALLSRPSRIDVAEDDQDRGVLAIRRAITAVRDDAEPASVAALQRSARHAWSVYWTNQFDVLGGVLPSLIGAARASARQTTTSPETFAVLSDVYGVAASTLVHLGHIDLAYLAMDRAIAAADRSDDPLRRASLSGWMSWLLLHQTGSSDQAQRLAVEEADRIEPRLGKAKPEQISVWGSLLVSGAVAAARQDQPAEADDLLNLAQAAATRLQADNYEVRTDYERPFGVPLVVMQSVDAAVVTDRPGRALEFATQMPPDAALPLAAKARHLADVANAQTSLGRDREATDTLLAIERAAPHWMRYQAYPRTIVRELLERERRARTPRLRGLAHRLGVA